MNGNDGEEASDKKPEPIDNRPIPRTPLTEMRDQRRKDSEKEKDREKDPKI